MHTIESFLPSPRDMKREHTRHIKAVSQNSQSIYSQCQASENAQKK